MKWRKEYGVNQLKLTDFPIEYFSSGNYFKHSHDKEGTETIYLIEKHSTNLNNATTNMHNGLFLYFVEQVNKKVCKKCNSFI